jgi:hypothetical protein
MIHPHLFGEELKAILKKPYVLRSVAGSGSEALRQFWTIAAAHVSRRKGTATRASLLLFKGGYTSGDQFLQTANSNIGIRSFSFAPGGLLAHTILTGPYSRMYEMDSDNGTALAHWQDMKLTDPEREALATLQATKDKLESRGEMVGGVVVEFVQAGKGRALRPAFAHALRQWLDVQSMLLFEDAVIQLSGDVFTILIFDSRLNA